MVQYGKIYQNPNGASMNTKKQIYTKDKTVKVTFRCDEVLGNWLLERSKVVGLTPSAFCRQLMYQNFYAEKTIGGFINSKQTSTETAVADGSDK